jgi:biopolymer transport protein ExbD
MKKRNLNQPQKVNVIPILDAVFIFVFFLLLSAQFLDLYQLNVSKPIFKDSEASDASAGADNKNFKLIIYREKIILTEGVNEKEIASSSWSKDSLDTFQNKLYSLKINNLKTDVMIIKPAKDLQYKKVVQAIDLAQRYYSTDKISGKLFRGLAFESME